MSLASRFPTVFSHHANLARASDRPDAPFMGAPEIAFKQIWLYSWTPVRAHLSSSMFTDQVGRQATPLTISTLVESYIDRAGEFLGDTQPIIHATILRAGHDAEHHYGYPMSKDAGEHLNPFRVGTPAYYRWQARYGAPSTTPSTIGQALDLTSQYAQLARNLSLNMVEGLTSKMKRDVRKVISDGFVRGERPELLGEQIGSIIGLNTRWIRAVENMRASMLARGISPRVVSRRCLKYGEMLLAKRGEMVARTEMMRAMNAGRHQYWLDQRGSGALGGDGDVTVVKRWVVKTGACDECLETADDNASGVPVAVEGLDTPFKTPYGDVLYPPLHPHCKCSVDYEVVPAG